MVLKLMLLLANEEECKIVEFPKGRRFEIVFSNRLKRELFYYLVLMFAFVKGREFEFITKNKGEKKLYVMLKKG